VCCCLFVLRQGEGGLISAEGLHESMNLDLYDVKTIISSIFRSSFKCCSVNWAVYFVT